VVDELTVLGCVTRLDGQLLAAWASATGRAAEAEELLNKLTGRARLLTESRHGSARANPLIAIISQAQRDAVHYAGLLGLTPSGRASLSVPQQQKGRADEFSKYFS
jgi:P27 family predicted phage terminase small subunit